MRILTQRPVYSKRWLGRPFILSENGLTWGRYSITDLDFRNSCKDEWDSVATALLETDPEQIATGFEVLLIQFMRFAHRDYLAEIAALYTYDLSKRHLAALKRVDCEPREYLDARAIVAANFEATLLTIFNSAAQVHGLGKANAVRYCQILHGMHDVTVFIRETTCHVAFTPDLILESIADKDDSRLWPPYRPPG